MARKPVANTGNSGRVGADKETEKLVKAARKAGWDVSVTGGNHIKFLPPNGEDAVIAGLTGGGYALPKLKNQLKKRGLHI